MLIDVTPTKGPSQIISIFMLCERRDEVAFMVARKVLFKKNNWFIGIGIFFYCRKRWWENNYYWV